MTGLPDGSGGIGGRDQVKTRVRSWLSELASVAVMLFVLAIWGWLAIDRLQALFDR
jgi:hypothetical protein